MTISEARVLLDATAHATTLVLSPGSWLLHAPLVLLVFAVELRLMCLSKGALQELGPRFTLKLVSLQKGTFDTKTGEFEWLHKRGEMDTSRRRFHL